MIIGVIADGLKKPARKAAKKLAKAEKAILARVLQEIVVIKSSKVKFYSFFFSCNFYLFEEKK